MKKSTTCDKKTTKKYKKLLKQAFNKGWKVPVTHTAEKELWIEYWNACSVHEKTAALKPTPPS